MVILHGSVYYLIMVDWIWRSHGVCTSGTCTVPHVEREKGHSKIGFDLYLLYTFHPTYGKA